MDFKLNFNIPKVANSINYHQSNLFVGSCFAQNIGEKFLQHKFNALINPCGILFNPLSVNTCLQLILNPNLFKLEHIVENNGVFYSWLHHGFYSATNKNELYNSIISELEISKLYLKQTQNLFITLGSAHAYKLNSTNVIVANCHKMPANLFTKVLLEPTQIIEELGSTIQEIKEANPAINIVLTVSPVKYLKDGVQQNNISKGILHYAVNNLCNTYNLSYFPAYEIINDELRDYRFYKEDFAHPTEQAINYVWEKFCNAYFDDNTIILQKQIAEILTAKNHRVLNANSTEYLKFKTAFYSKTKALSEQLPFINFTDELAYFLPN